MTLLFLSSIGHTQSLAKLDSLRTALKDSTDKVAISYYYKIADRYNTAHQLRDSQYINIERGIRLAKKVVDNYQLAEGYLDIGYYHVHGGQYIVADSLFDLSFQLYESEENATGMGKIYLARAHLAGKKQRNMDIIKHTMDAKKMFEKSGDTRGAVISTINIGVNYTKVKQYEESLRYFSEAYQQKKALSPGQISHVIFSMALSHWHLYEEQSDTLRLDSALMLIKEGSKLATEKDILYYQLQFKQLEVKYNLIQKKYTEAILETELLIAEGHRIGKEKIICQGFQVLADAYQGLGKYQSALSYADSTLKYGLLMKWDAYISSGLKRKYTAYKALGQYKNALNFLEQYKEINDTISRVEAVAKLKEVESKYETAEKEKSILQLNKEAALLKQRALLRQQEIKNKNYLLLILGIGTLSAIIFFFLLYQRKIQEEKKKAEDIKQQLWRAQMNPHFLFNALNSIQRFYVEGKTAEANDFLADFGDLLRKILDRSSKPLVSISEEVAFLKLYLDLEKRRLSKTLNYNIQLTENLKAFEYQIPSLLLQPIVENAIWHGIMKTDRDGFINIQISQEEEGIKCIIQDNGIGYKSTSTPGKNLHRSKGLELIKNRLGKNGWINIEEIDDASRKVTGTRVTIFIRL